MLMFIGVRTEIKEIDIRTKVFDVKAFVEFYLSQRNEDSVET